MKKLLYVICVLGLLFSVTACGVEIEDTNGADDYSLATITEDNIINMDLGASGYSISPGADEQENLSELTTIKGKSFSGVAEIYSTNFIMKSDLCIYIGTMNVKEGNFKLMVLVNDEIVHEFELDEFNETYTLEDVKGYVSIRMAGESANFKYEIQAY